MGDRGPFRFLATAMSGQSNQRRQDYWERSPADEESGQYLFQDGGQHAQFRRFRTKLGSPIAIKAMVAKLARLVYRMLRYGMNVWTKERSSTRPNTATYRSNSSSGKLPSWDFKLSKLLQLKARVSGEGNGRLHFAWRGQLFVDESTQNGKMLTEIFN
jgi:hypothetical protein